MAALQVGKLPPALPTLQTQLELSLLQAGFLLSAVQGSGMVLGLLLGQWIDGYGLRRSMFSGLVCLAAGSAMGALSSFYPPQVTVTVLLASRLLEGVGFLLTVLPGPALLRRSVKPEQLSPFLGYWGTYMPIGMSSALLLGPFWLHWAPWNSWWGLFSLLSALMAVAISRGVDPDPIRAGPRAAGAAVAVLGPVVLNTAQVAGDDPIKIGFITAISSAFGYLTAAAQPAFTIIYASGYLRAGDFLKIGWRMMLISVLLLFLLAGLYWPLISG